MHDIRCGLCCSLAQKVEQIIELIPANNADTFPFEDLTFDMSVCVRVGVCARARLFVCIGDLGTWTLVTWVKCIR
jgi:hypothetical protein